MKELSPMSQLLEIRWLRWGEMTLITSTPFFRAKGRILTPRATPFAITKVQRRQTIKHDGVTQRWLIKL